MFWTNLLIRHCMPINWRYLSESSMKSAPLMSNPWVFHYAQPFSECLKRHEMYNNKTSDMYGGICAISGMCCSGINVRWLDSHTGGKDVNPVNNHDTLAIVGTVQNMQQTLHIVRKVCHLVLVVNSTNSNHRRHRRWRPGIRIPLFLLIFSFINREEKWIVYLHHGF